jgi:hypothetical protein
MKAKTKFQTVIPLVAGIVIGAALVRDWHGADAPFVSSARAQDGPANPAAELMALRLDVAMLKSKATDQSHVMADVGYHFANLWFAGTSNNWPLAKFYFDETRSHINWAVRVIPVRKDSAGRDVELKPIWEAIDSSIFTEIKNAIEQKDSAKFAAVYRLGIEGCYSCHKASSKPYLRTQIPKVPPQPIINFDPEAKWPQ